MSEEVTEVTEDAVEESTEEKKMHCFHHFVPFKNRRKCIKCGLEIDK